MAIVVFYNESLNYRIPDGTLINFYSSFNTSLTQILASAYTLNSAINVDLQQGYSYLVTLSGNGFTDNVYYATLPLNTDEIVVTIVPPVSSILSPEVITGPQGATGSSGFFEPVSVIYDFVVGSYVFDNYQTITLSDITPFVVGSYIQLFNQQAQISGIFQVVQTTGTYFANGANYPLQNNQILVAAVDLTNGPYGYGCQNGDIFSNSNSVVLYGATGISRSIASITDFNINNPQQNDVLIYKNGKITNLPYLIYEIFGFANEIPVNTVIHRHLFVRNVNIIGGLGYAKISPFQEAVFNISKNGILVGNITFYPNGSATCSITGSSNVNCTYGDVIEVISPSVQDLLLENIVFTLNGFLL